jgi:hypothetical protein
MSLEIADAEVVEAAVLRHRRRTRQVRSRELIKEAGFFFA